MQKEFKSLFFFLVVQLDDPSQYEGRQSILHPKTGENSILWKLTRLKIVKETTFEIIKNTSGIVGYNCTAESRNFRSGARRHYLLALDI